MLLKYFDILEVFSRDLNKEWYATELAKLLKANQKTISNSLNYLAKKQILTYDYRGKNKLFKLKTYYKTKLLLYQLEYQKLANFQSNLDLLVLTESLSKILNTFLIFGSYAKGTQKETSDIDIIAIGKYDLKAIEKLEKTHDLRISIVHFTKRNFKLDVNSTLIVEAKKNHIIVKGFEFFIETLYEEEFAYS